MLFLGEGVKRCFFLIGIVLNIKRRVVYVGVVVYILKLLRVVMLMCMEMSFFNVGFGRGRCLIVEVFYFYYKIWCIK